METYRIDVRYTPQGRQEPQAFSKAWSNFQEKVEKTGGKIVNWYGQHGHDDLLVIFQVPNPEDATRCVLTLSEMGLAETSTHALIPGERYLQITNELAREATSSTR